MKSAFTDIINFILDDEEPNGYRSKLSQKFDSSLLDVSNFLKIGKYRLEPQGTNGYESDFNINKLSTLTQKNIKILIDSDWVFSKIIAVPRHNRNASSIYILGIDPAGANIIYARKETASPVAGQTKIYWMDRWDYASRVVNRCVRGW